MQPFILIWKREEGKYESLLGIGWESKWCVLPSMESEMKRTALRTEKKKLKYPVALLFHFKCHLASGTGGHGLDLAARSWEQIRDLPRISEGLKEDET